MTRTSNNATFLKGTIGRLLVFFIPMLAVLALSAAPALAAAPEAPETTKASRITAATAMLEGVLNPKAEATAGWYFAYTTEIACEIAPLTTPVAPEEEVKAKAEEFTAEGLQPNKEYTFCMVATNPEGETPSIKEPKFKTQPIPPTIVFESAPAPKATEAKLEAAINPNNQKTKYEFEYATTAKAIEGGKGTKVIGASELPEEFNEAGTAVSVETGAVLAPGTTYFYRMIAENAGGEKAVDAIQHLLTGPPETPIEDQVKAQSTTATSVEVEGVLNPSRAGETGTYEFLYSEGTGCEGGSATAANGAGGGKREKVSAKLENLVPNTEYTFCLRAHNEAGEAATGPPVMFTPHAAAPAVAGESVTGVSETSATVHAKVNPEGFDTHVYVEYGAKQFTEPVDIGPVVGEQEVSFALGGLKVGTTYPLRFVAFNADGTVPGAGIGFRTLSPPPAHGEHPWWGLTSGSWPTNLHAGVAESEVQEITVSATEGVVELQHKASVAFLPFNATHEAVQAALEGMLGAGNVQVTGGTGDEKGDNPYVVTFMGGLADQPVTIEASSFSFVPLKGGTRANPIEVREAIKGRPDGKVIVTAENLGDAPADGSATPTVIEDALPEHVKAIAVEAVAGAGSESLGPVSCSVTSAHMVRCVFEHVLPSYELIELRISVKLAGASSGEANAVTVSGGGANVATMTKPISMGASTGFGVADYQMLAEEEGGATSTQAGVHPFQLTTITTLDTSEVAPLVHDQQPVGMAKDLTFKLPPGLIGNPTPLPQCTDAQFSARERSNQGSLRNECEAKTAIGVATITYDAPPAAGLTTTAVPLFNLVPLAGEPARFGFEIVGVPTFLDTSVRTGGDYGVTVKVSNITEIPGFISSKVTFWGVPGEPVHDNSRGWQCTEERMTGCSAGVSKPPPFLSMPTSCTGPMSTTVQADSWEEPHPPHPTEVPLFAEYMMGGMDGCNRLQFSPEVRVTPDGTQASKPTGLNVDVHVPQTGALNPEGLAESAVKDITVALPEGVAVNPAGGNGLASCSEGLAGFTGFGEPEHFATFTGTLPEPLQPGVNFCADASKIGEVTIKSPLLPPTQPLKGFVYLASQNENPFGSLIALYLIAKDPISGTVVKLTGETQMCQGPGEMIDGMTCQGAGQIIATFLHNPQLAFEDAELHFFGEERAPLTSPAHCRAYTTNATFAPWSGTASVGSSSTFNITSGPNGTPCPGANLPFSPSLTGGTTNINAGSFSPLTMTIAREDGQQDMQSVQLHMPAGLSGLLSGVKLCPEAQANEGTCGPESQIGETTVSAGVGNDPVTVTGGRVYITEKYAGAPFGLSIVNPVKAGPFDLEHDTSNPSQNPACDCVVVRAKIEVDPTTTALTITTDPSGPHAIPHLIDGIPVQIKKVNVLVNREHFTFNPTNCNLMALTGSITGDEGGAQPLSVPFQATNCAVLKFAPKFAVSTNGKTSKANGASLKVKLAYPNAPQGTQANIATAKVELPKQLPSRLTTLQKACTAAQFGANPGGCPAASVIGHARATTPILPVPLEGPAYFVSHGGEAFPSLIVVLQGYGVTVDLVGTTFISKAGITSSTFKTVPDVPVGSFELTLPQGRYSALTANGNLCTSKLAMPTEFIAQNGMVLHQKTAISVTGCPKAKLTRAQKLVKALKVCRKDKAKHKRVACERLAHKRYGPVKKANKGAVRKKK